MSSTGTDEPDFEGYRAVTKHSSAPVTDLYRGEQIALERPVLIKALGRGIMPGSPFASALEREARLLTALDHPGVIRAYDFVKNANTMWLVLEYVDGFTLDELIAGKTRMSTMGAVAIALAVVTALEHVHERGIVHRDLRPSNILVARSGAVKLANFAAATDQRLPTAPELLEGSAGFGTLAYMSPEQLLGEREDPRSDLFSIGIVLYEMLVGEKPFAAEDDRAASHRVRHDPAPSPSRAAKKVPGALDRIVRRCLAKLPSDRQESAAELARELRPFLEEGGYSSTEAAVRDELARLGLVTPSKEETARRDPPRPMKARPRAASIGTAVRGQALALVFIVAGGGLIRYSAHKSRKALASGGETRLELTPANPGFLRVVADPWANVIVDGEPVETTPFAHSIPLAAGTHYLRLEHPNAPVERRTVTVSPGQTVLVDVKMDVPRGNAPRPDTTPLPSLSDPSTP